MTGTERSREPGIIFYAQNNLLTFEILCHKVFFLFSKLSQLNCYCNLGKQTALIVAVSQYSIETNSLLKLWAYLHFTVWIGYSREEEQYLHRLTIGTICPLDPKLTTVNF